MVAQNERPRLVSNSISDFGFFKKHWRYPRQQSNNASTIGRVQLFSGYSTAVNVLRCFIRYSAKTGSHPLSIWEMAGRHIINTTWRWAFEFDLQIDFHQSSFQKDVPGGETRQDHRSRVREKVPEHVCVGPLWRRNPIQPLSGRTRVAEENMRAQMTKFPPL